MISLTFSQIALRFAAYSRTSSFVVNFILVSFLSFLSFRQGKALPNSHNQAAVGDDGLARDIGRKVRGKERHDVGDFLRLAEAPHGDILHVFFLEELAVGLRHAGVDKAGGDDVGADAVPCVFFGDRLGEGDDCALGGGVIRLPLLTDDAAGRGDVDDRAAVLGRAHQADRALRAVIAAVEICFDNGVKGLAAHIKLEHNQFVTTNRSAAVELRITLECFGTEHKEQIMAALEKKGYKPRIVRTMI